MPAPDPLPWLLELDEANPSVRYFALRDLLDLPEMDGEVQKARSAISQTGPVPVILAAQEPAGYWVKPGSGYSPKYRSGVWCLLILAELGASPDDPRLQKGGHYLLEHSLASTGAFSAYQGGAPSGAVPCLNGNLLFALQRLGFGDDPRLQTAIDCLARSILGEQPVQYYRSGPSGPTFACGANLGQPCAWGANKAMRGLLEISREKRSPLVKRALRAGAHFLLSRDPAVADYPYSGRASSAWFKLGFPLSYWSDVLETLANLVDLGYAKHPRLQNAFHWLLSKRGPHGRWKLANSLNGKTWIDIEAKGQPSKWITLRALRLLKKAGLSPDAIAS